MLLAEPLYFLVDAFDPANAPWSTLAVASAPLAPLLFHSLLNTTLAFDPVGWGIPYGAEVAEDAPAKLHEKAVQVLLLLLDFGNNVPGEASDVAPAAEAAAEAAAEGPPSLRPPPLRPRKCATCSSSCWAKSGTRAPATTTSPTRACAAS